MIVGSGKGGTTTFKVTGMDWPLPEIADDEIVTVPV